MNSFSGSISAESSLRKITTPYAFLTIVVKFCTASRLAILAIM